MSRKPESYWKEHVDLWKESGLTLNAYCKKHNIFHSTLSRWTKKLDNSKTKPIKITLPVKEYITREFLIESRNLTIKIPESIDATLLQIIIRELK